MPAPSIARNADVLRVVVVELVGRHDLADERRFGFVVADHGAFNFARVGHGGFDHQLAIVVGGEFERGEELGGVVDFRNADARAHVRGLHEHGIAERFLDALRDRVAVGEELAPRDDDPVGDP